MGIKEIKLNVIQLKIFNDLTLKIELVPKTCWWNNVRGNITRTQWDKLREKVCTDARNKCEICGGIGSKHPVECHEIWDYDEISKIQTLKKFIAICPLCHQVKHIGLTKLKGLEYFDRAYQWFQLINELSNDETKLFYDYYWQQWRMRNKMKWDLDIRLLNNYGINISDNSKSRIEEGTFQKTTEKDFKCPYCGEKNFIRLGKTIKKLFRYKCKSCLKNFISNIDTNRKKEILKHLFD